MRTLFTIALGLLLSTLATATGADNWPTWRGPDANGVAPKTANPPTTWSNTTNIKWKAALTGKGSASPIVWGDQVFVVTATKTDRVATAAERPQRNPKLEAKTTAPMNFYKFEVMSFDKNTGKLKWSHIAAEMVPHEGTHPSHSYAAGSPTTDGKRLYVSFGSFGIYAYDLDGKLLWKRDLGRMTTRLGWGEAVTPVVHNDTLLLNWDQEVDSKLIALNAATGVTKWEVARDERTSWNTPCVVEHAGKTQVIVNGTNRVRSYNLADGSLIWQCAGMSTNAIPSPLISNGVAILMSGYQRYAAIAVSLDSTGDVTDSAKQLWKYSKGTPYVPSGLLYDGRLYFTQANTPMLTILNPKTGKPILEGDRLPNVNSFYASPMAAAGRLYFVDRDGTTIVMKAGDKPELISVNKLDDKIDACPAVIGKTLFLRGEKFLYAIEEK